jgi:hypothetical protein
MNAKKPARKTQQLGQPELVPERGVQRHRRYAAYSVAYAQ